MEVLLVLVFVFGVALYFLPSIIAGARKHASGAGIFLVNALFGWTVLGWIAALIWATSGESNSADRTAECPHCRERVSPAASVCPHCQRDLNTSAASSSPTARGEYRPGRDVYEIK